ncbi:MAG: hypothetical protein GC181_04705 [Bacteroidetes bacterium]|nr:hypothetical protein [Bacteroidota bacterium]
MIASKGLFKLSSFLLIIILVGLTQHSNAQTRGFSRDPKVYIDELGAHVKSVQKPEVHKVYDALKVKWNSGIFNEDQQAMVIRVSEYMLINEFDIDPDFHLFMKTLLVARDSSVAQAKFDNWIAETYKLLKSNRQAYKTVLQTSYNLFSDGALYSDRSKTWSIGKADFKFIFKEEDVLIEIKRLDLKCKGPDDEINVYNTSGTYDVLKQSWKGKGGSVNWSRVGINPSVAYATIPDYSIDMTKGEMEVKNVEFQYKGVLSEKVTGTLSDKISSGVISNKNQDFSNSTYPRFVADRKDLTLNNFTNGSIKFKGGFAIEGKNIQGIGDENNKSTFEFYYEGKLVVQAVSAHFTMKDGKINALETEMTIFTDSGTIFHPIIRMNYNQADSMLVFTRGDKGLEQAPFYDTDHNLEIWVDQIRWKLQQPKIDFDMILNDDRARFESKNYYREFNFEKITNGGMMPYHPVLKMYEFCIKTKVKKFPLSSYAAFVGSKKENMYQQMYKLADEGFIYYDPETEMVTPKEKLFNHYKYHYKLGDYDVIRFSSVIASRANAELNLINYDLKIEGIPAFRFSDSQNVMAVPEEQIVIVKNNRKLLFDGKITAGRFDFFGDRFLFDYEKFTVSSEKIDSMKIFYPDTINQNFLIPVKSVLRDINGTLYIDKSNNKSGLTDYPEYPIFTSRAPSVIAYDKQHIFNGAYKKDIFRFEVDPFTIDSLDDFTIEGLKFPGTFVSAGILPEFRYEAYIMKDYSLGFNRTNPPGGYEMYEGKGHGDIDISLSEEGFWAKGEIDYQGAKMQSNKIVMMPDSLNADVDVYSIDKSERYPRLYARDVKTHWMPKEEEMFISTEGHTVEVFEAKQTFTGKMKHTPVELSGNGVLAWDNATLTSTDMRFSPDETDAAVSAIKIGDVDAGKISFVSTNVKSHIDFQKRTGEFRANELGHVTQLPYNMMTSTMDDFKWDMDKKTILMTATGRMKKDDYVFRSTNPAQQGLFFISTKALFDMNTGIIYAEEIPYIDIADSRVFPFEGKAVIEKDAYIQPLKNSKVLAARENKFHELYDCTINVLGRNSLTGQGFYIYKDKHRTGQVIYFDKMRILRDTTYQAIGYMTDSLNFTISPKIGYKGSVELNSNQEFLSFNGYVKPLHSFSEYKSLWFRYTDRPDPADVIINAHDPKNEERKGIAVTMSYSMVDSVNLYPSFFNFKRSYGDLDVTNDKGILYYDETRDAFIVGDSNKALNGSPRGNILVFNEGDKTISSEGRLDFGLNFHENFNIQTAGTVSKEEDDTVFNVETLMGMRLKLPDECYQRLLQVIEKNGGGTRSISVDNDETKRAISEFLDDKKYQKVRKDMEEVGEIKSVDEINHDILISRANFYYSKPLQAFVSTSTVDVALIDGKVVNKAFDSRILIETKRSGTRFIFYMKVSEYDWFYFEFYRGNMYIYSTDKEFNDYLMSKRGKTSSKGYTIRPATPIKISRQIEKIDALTGS